MVEQKIDILTWILQNIKDSCQDLAKKWHPKIPKTQRSDFVIWLFCKADLLSIHFDMTHFSHKTWNKLAFRIKVIWNGS